jgi:hypothetical protein
MTETAETSTTKKAKKSKPKAAKEPKVKKEKAPKREDLCVFAFRLPVAERDLIHKAADTKDVSATKFVVDTIMETSRKVLDRA